MPCKIVADNILKYCVCFFLRKSGLICHVSGLPDWSFWPKKVPFPISRPTVKNMATVLFFFFFFFFAHEEIKNQ